MHANNKDRHTTGNHIGANKHNQKTLIQTPNHTNHKTRGPLGYNFFLKRLKKWSSFLRGTYYFMSVPLSVLMYTEDQRYNTKTHKYFCIVFSPVEDCNCYIISARCSKDQNNSWLNVINDLTSCKHVCITAS